MKLFSLLITALFFGLLQPSFAADADHDGMDDAWQSLYSIAPFTGSLDPDNDGRPNLVEAINASHPNDASHPDTGWGMVIISDNNQDLLDDGWAAQYMQNGVPLVSSDDQDGDGRKNLEESITGSNPWVADTPSSNAGSTPGVGAGLEEFTLALARTVPTARYRLQVSDDLVNWSYDTTETSTFWGSGAGQSLTVPVPGLERRFYRYVIDWPDTDGEGLTDWIEYLLGSNPLEADSNGNGLDDLFEYEIGILGGNGGGTGSTGITYAEERPAADIQVIRERRYEGSSNVWPREFILHSDERQRLEMYELFDHWDGGQNWTEAAGPYFWNTFAFTAVRPLDAGPLEVFSAPKPLHFLAVMSGTDEMLGVPVKLAAVVKVSFPSATGPALIETTLAESLPTALALTVNGNTLSVRLSLPQNHPEWTVANLYPINVAVKVIVPEEPLPVTVAGGEGDAPFADGGSSNGGQVGSSSTSSTDPDPGIVGFDTKPAKELKVAKLEHALDEEHKITAYLDHDCFFVVIEALEIRGVMHQRGQVKVKISTHGATDYPEHNDPAGENEWISLDPVTSRWATPAQLLVADKGVDDLPAGQDVLPENPDAPYPADEQANDRTHVVELGGTVKIGRIKILTDELPLDIELPVRKKREISVRAVCMDDQDINVSGAKHYFKIANERLAQVGVKLKVDSILPMAVPTNLITNSSIMAVIKPTGATRYTLGPEAKALVDTYKAKLYAGMKADDMVVFFCEQVKYPGDSPVSGQCVRGLATFSSYANSIGNFADSGFDPPTPGYVNKIFISDEHRGIFTTAHEIMHCISDHGHYQENYNPDDIGASHHKVTHNLMRLGTTPTEGIGGTKRLHLFQEKLVFPTN